MSRYSIWSLARNGLLHHHENWPQAWRRPEPKPDYDVVIVGGGGHGLATAYYLAKEHGITDVAVLEKGCLGGGNVGRNTTIVRANYLRDVPALRAAGAEAVFAGEGEVALAMTEAVLMQLGATPDQIDRERQRVHEALIGDSHELTPARRAAAS